MIEALGAQLTEDHLITAGCDLFISFIFFLCQYQIWPLDGDVGLSSLSC